jgi:cytochrome P450
MSREAHVSGGEIPAGKPVFLCGAAANRDPDATDAEVFDIERNQTEAQHLGLGYMQNVADYQNVPVQVVR